MKTRSLKGRENKSITSSNCQLLRIFCMEAYLQQKIEELKAKNLYRRPKDAAKEGFLNFTSNDYLGLRTHPAVIEAAVKATEKYGAGSGASRLAGGNYALHDEFEEKIAAYKGYEAACVFGSGYMANLGVIQAFAGEGDEVVTDKLAHASIIDGVRLSGADLVRFAHNDVEDLQRRITEKTKLVITEEIFSMDGDKAPNILISPLMLDGAHSLYGPGYPEAEIYVGTMSKALGSYGAYVCGSRQFIDYIKSSARSLIYSTALPPAALGAAIKALEIAQKEKLYLKTLENAKLLGSDSAIIPIIIGDEATALEAEAHLREKNILVNAIRTPTVPKGKARLRITVTAKHTKEEIEKLAEALKFIL